MHVEMNELMQQALDGDLRQDERERLESHLTGCAACSADWLALQQVHAQLGGAAQQAPAAGFDVRVMRRIAERQRPPWLSGAGALFLLLADIGLLSFVLAQWPLDFVLHPDEWLALPQLLVALAGDLSAWIGIAATIAHVLGDGPLLLFALLTFALTLGWVRLVSGPALFKRPVLVNGGT